MTNLTIQEASEQIQKILEDNNFALQPYINYMPHGILPSVRLVDLTKKENDNKGENQGEVGDAQDEVGTTEPE